MTVSFLRKWKVQVGELSTTDLRVQFRVTKTLTKEPNTCDLRIHNFSKASRGKLTGANLPVVLEAGYQGQTGQSSVIFSGQARSVDDLRERADWVTHVQCGDGEKAYQFARVNKSFGAGKTFNDVVEDVAKTLSANIGNLKDALKKDLGNFTDFKNGFTAFGRSSDVLAGLLKSKGFNFSIQQGALLVTKPGEPTNGTAIRLTPQTGLIGSPDHTPPDSEGKPATLKCKCLLNAQLIPAGLIRVASARVNGDFVIQKVEHSGDTHGQEWVTTIEAWAKK